MSKEKVVRSMDPFGASVAWSNNRANWEHKVPTHGDDIPVSGELYQFFGYENSIATESEPKIWI